MHNYLACYLLWVQSRLLDWANVAYERRATSCAWVAAIWAWLSKCPTDHCSAGFSLFGQSAVSRWPLAVGSWQRTQGRACKFLHSALVGSCRILIYANEIYATHTTCDFACLRALRFAPSWNRKIETEMALIFYQIGGIYEASSTLCVVRHYKRPAHASFIIYYIVAGTEGLSFACKQISPTNRH